MAHELGAECKFHTRSFFSHATHSQPKAFKKFPYGNHASIDFVPYIDRPIADDDTSLGKIQIQFLND